jgi:hypothetical protein
MHCHLIVSRKDQTNKKKFSPLTNHKNTQKGVIKGGFDRTNLFRQTEQGFDKLFNYNRPLTESFEYYNTMKNGSITEQLKMQEKQNADERENKQDNFKISNIENEFENFQENKLSNRDESRQSSTSADFGLSSALSLLTPDANNKEEEQQSMKRKKKKPRQ